MEFVSDPLLWLVRWGLMLDVMALLVIIFCLVIIKIDVWRGGLIRPCDDCDWSLLGIAFTLCGLALVVVNNL